MRTASFESVHSLYCDACDVKCRLEVTGRGPERAVGPARRYCGESPTKDAAWETDYRAPHHTPGSVSAYDDGSRLIHVCNSKPVLLACFECPAPCLMEISGTANTRRCAVLPTREASWIEV